MNPPRLLSLFSILLTLEAQADRMYLLNQPGYNTAGPEIIAAIQANGHTVVVNNSISLPAGFTSTCVDAVNGYDWLLLFGNSSFNSIFADINSFIDVGGKVFYQYEVSCCTTSSAGAADLLTYLTGLNITANANDYIALGGAPAFSGYSPGDCYLFQGNAYKGLDGVPAANQYIATQNIGASSPAVSVCPNFGFFFTGAQIQGQATDGAIVGLGDVNIWFNGAEPGNTVSAGLVNYFFPANNLPCQTFQADCTFVPEPQVFGSDTLLCQGTTLLLDATWPGALGYLWNDGSQLPTQTINSAGTYWVDIATGNGLVSDTIVVNYEFINLGISPDVTICVGQSTNLQASGANSYQWAPAAGLNNAQIANPVASPLLTTTYTVTGTGTICTATASVTVTVTPAEIDFEPVIEPVVCAVSGSILIDNLIGSFPNFNTTIDGVAEPDLLLSPATAGNHTVVITDALGCQLTTVLTVPDNSYQPTMQLAVVQPVCALAGSIEIASVQNAQGTLIYELNNQVQPGTLFSSLQAGNFVVEVSDENGCTTSQNVVLVNVPNSIQFIHTDVQPVCNTPGSITVSNMSGGLAPYTFSLNGSAVGGNQAINLQAGNYTLTITDDAGCTASQNTILTNTPNLIGLTLSPSPAICLTPGYLSAVSVTGASLPYSLLLDGQPFAGVNTPVAAGNHALQVVDNDGCTATENFTINTINHTHAIASASPPVGYNPLEVQFVNSSINADTWVWTLDNNVISTDEEPSYTYLNPGNYTVTLLATDSQNGCTDLTEIFINVKPFNAIWLPNAFTPDGDGVNEVFRVYGEGIIEKDFKLQILDRWGTIIFETTNPNEPWIGQVNGGEHYAQNEVFIYRVQYRYLDSVSPEELRGHVVMIR